LYVPFETTVNRLARIDAEFISAQKTVSRLEHDLEKLAPGPRPMGGTGFLAAQTRKRLAKIMPRQKDNAGVNPTSANPKSERSAVASAVE
jgi:hypothetical protein